MVDTPDVPPADYGESGLAPGETLSASVDGDRIISFGGFVRALRQDAKRTVAVVVGLAVVGAALGGVWLLWSPPRPIALVIKPGAVLPDESESFISTDARYLILTGAAGLLAAFLTWAWRSYRGPAAVLALGIGSAASSLACLGVGRLFGGGTDDGAAHSIVRSPLSVHAPQFLAFQAFVAVAVYACAAVMCERDDLARPTNTATTEPPERNLGDPAAKAP